MQTTTYKLNVTPGGVPLTIHISQYDVGLRQYTFQPYTNVGEFTYVSGATVTLEATKPDGYGVVHECTYNQDGITYTLQEQLAAKPGRVWSKVVIRDGADVLGTGAVIWIVDCAGLKDDAIVSESDMSGIRGMIDDEVKRTMSESVISSLPNSNASGAVAHFTDGAYDIPVRDLKIGIVPKQSGTGDPSPSNVRPITGWTGANVVRTGKNILSTTVEEIKNLNNTGTWSGNVYSFNGLTFTINVNNDGSIASINVNGTSTAESFLILFQNTPNPIKILHEAILNGCPSGSTSSTYRLQANSITDAWYNAYVADKIIPSGEDVKYCRIDVLSGVTVNNVVFYPMIRFASDLDPTYEPYTAQTYPISWQSEAGTVYGGTLDVTSGKLTVDRGYINFNGSEEWTLSGSGTSCFYTGLQNTIKKVSNTAVANIKCNRFNAVTDNATSGGTIGISVYNLGYIRICHTGATTTVADFKTWLASNNVQVVYELATPQTYQLTPTEVRTLLGNNNILADTGDTEVEYKADTTLYIDKKLNATKSIIAGVEVEYKATKNYSIGNYVIVNDALYKVTSAIASGASITPGTNCTQTTVAEQLILLANA